MYNKQERCVNILENPFAVHGCEGKKCGDECLMGDIMGKCDASGHCEFEIHNVDCGRNLMK